MLRVLMLGIVLLATESRADSEPLNEASQQTGPARAAAQSAIDQVEDTIPRETFDEVAARAGTVPPGDFPLLEQALADPDKRSSIGALMADAEALAAALQAPSAAEAGLAVYVFVSFSMPDGSLRTLIRQGELAGAPVVLRGLVDDSVEATLERVHALYQESPQTGLLIDPTLFARFNVDEVPTVIVTDGDAGACTREVCPVPAHVRIAGDVPLRYALDRVASAAPRYRDRLRPLLAALEPGRTW